MLKLKQENTLLQGNIGLSIAISWCCMQGYIVSLPLNDICDYDIVADVGGGTGELIKIQVKTTTSKNVKGEYRVQLQTGARKSFANNCSDYLFVLDGDGNKYLFPKDHVQSAYTLTLTDKYREYIV